MASERQWPPEIQAWLDDQIRCKCGAVINLEISTTKTTMTELWVGLNGNPFHLSEGIPLLEGHAPAMEDE